MTVKQLKEYLNNFDDDDLVCKTKDLKNIKELEYTDIGVQKVEKEDPFKQIPLF